MQKYPIVLSVAGSDSGGGAGIQADIKAISACGSYAMTAITAITAQNTTGVQAIYPLPVSIIEQQIRSVLDDMGADAIKIGMLHSVEIIVLVARMIREYGIKNVVVDPVMVATSGDRLLHEEAISAILSELFPLATVVTPNIPEASLLSAVEIRSEDDFALAAKVLLQQGVSAVLVKAGHIQTDTLTDQLWTPTSLYSYPHSRILSNNTHGTGCSLSSALAAYLSQGDELPEATRKAVDYIHQAIQKGADYLIGKGHGPVKHFF